MSFQVLRIETYKKTALQGLGGETERDGREKVKHKNDNIVSSLSYKNVFLKKSTQGYRKDWQRIMDELHVQSVSRKTADVLDGMVITSDGKFFERLGWRPGMAPTAEIKDFFDGAYRWALKEIGFQGTDRNVISACIHVDEKTPHLHIYYVPVTDRWREKRYAKDADGHVLRKGKNPIPLRGRDGKIVYEEKCCPDAPRLNRSEFWRIRGGKDSYMLMQDSFYADVAQKWQLDRGEKGTGRKHINKREYEKMLTSEIADSVAYVESIEARQGVLDRHLGTVTVDKGEFQDLKRHALAYATARPVLDSVTDREKVVVSREAEAEKGVKANQKKERELFELQFSLHKRENAIFDAELKLQEDRQKLQQERQELQQGQKELQEEWQELQRQRDASGVSQEIAMLKETIAQKDADLEKSRQESKDFREWAGQLYAEKTGSAAAEKIQELEKSHAVQVQMLEKTHAVQVQLLEKTHAVQLQELENVHLTQVQILDRKHKEEMARKAKEVQETKGQMAAVVSAKQTVIDSLIVAVKALVYVASAILRKYPEIPLLHEAVSVGRESLAAVGATVGQEVPDILRQKTLKTSRDTGLGL